MLRRGCEKWYHSAVLSPLQICINIHTHQEEHYNEGRHGIHVELVYQFGLALCLPIRARQVAIYRAKQQRLHYTARIIVSFGQRQHRSRRSLVVVVR